MAQALIQLNAGRREKPPFLVMLLILLLMPAGEVFGRGNYQSYKITSFEMIGNHAIQTSDAREIMVLTKGGRFRAGRYLKRWLDRDLEELIRVYRTMGYLEADLISRKEVRNREERTVSILLEISEGPRTLVESLRFEGSPDLPRAPMLKRLSLVEGAPYNPTLLGRDQYRIFSYLAENGYPGATVEYADTTIDNRARITFHIRPGPRARIGGITVAGNEKTRGEFVLRELTFHEGEWFNRRTLLESRDRLFQTGLYVSVVLAPEVITPEETVPIRIEVRERNLRWFGFGAGFGTEDQFRTSVDWNNRNILGSGKKASLEVVFSELLADRDIEHRYQITLIEPWMFGTRTAGALSLSHLRQNIENYEIPSGDHEGEVIEGYRLIDSEIGFSLSRDLTHFTRGSVAYSIGWADAREPSEPVDSDLLKPEAIGAITLSLERDSRDHLLDPSRGSRTYLSTEYAGFVLGGDNHYLLSIVEGATYARLIGSSVFACRAQVNYLRPLATRDELPDYKRFRLGGANTVRGYRADDIGPGDFSILANVELRFPLFWKLALALFLDGGTAWQNFQDIKAKDFRMSAPSDEVERDEFHYGAGGGLRLNTPVGPIRLDYGKKLKRRISDSGVMESADAWHISIGQAF